MKMKSLYLTTGLAAVCVAAVLACNGLGGNLNGLLPGLGNNNGPGGVIGALSPGRLNAARRISNDSANIDLTVDIMQRDPTNPSQNRCDPLGNFGADVPWDSTIGGPKTFQPTLARPLPGQVVPPHYIVGEYDWLFTATNGAAENETEYILSIRVPNPDLVDNVNFTQVEFNFRAVNPNVYTHLLGDDYGDSQAILPSNDDDEGLRSLFNSSATPPAPGSPDARDVAIIVQGIRFNNVPGGPSSSKAFMRALGPTAWLLFMRDNGYQSGRFYAIVGAKKGGPVAFGDVPPATVPPNPAQGFFQSAQVTGDGFDANAEPDATMDLTAANAFVCNTAAPPTFGAAKAYAFQDRSNLDESIFAPTTVNGRGGFLLVIRQEAFATGAGSPIGRVVLDPSGAPSDIVLGDTIVAPPSGYNEIPLNLAGVVDDNANNDITDHSADAPALRPSGVHEMSCSVFFIHKV